MSTPNVYTWKFLEEPALNGTSPGFGPLSGYTAIVTAVDVVTGGLSLGTVQLLGAGGGAIWTQSEINIGTAYYNWRGRYVIDPGELAYVAVTGSTMAVTVNGYMLLGLPPS